MNATDPADRVANERGGGRANQVKCTLADEPRRMYLITLKARRREEQGEKLCSNRMLWLYVDKERQTQ